MRHLLVVGDGAHGDALAGLQEEPAEAGEEQQATTAPSSWIGGRNSRADDDRLVADRQRQVARLDAEAPAARSRAGRRRAPMVAMTTAMTGRPSSWRSTTRSRAKPKPIMTSSDDDDGGHQRRLPTPSAGRHDHAGDHDELALGEVDGVGRLVDQHEAQRDQRVHQPDRGRRWHEQRGGTEARTSSDMARPARRRRPRWRRSICSVAWRPSS